MSKYFFVFFFLFSNIIPSQNILKGDAYLKKNSFELNSFFSNSKNTIDTSSVLYLSGEAHFMKGNENIKLNLFKYLYINCGVRVFLLEEGFSYGYYYNSFLESGDYEKLKYDLFVLDDSKYFLNEILAFYNSLPKNDKFYFEGVDSEDMIPSSINLIKSFLQKKEKCDEKIKPEIDAFLNYMNNTKTFNTYSSKSAKPFLNNLYNSLYKYPNEYESFLTHDYYSFQKILNGTKKYYEWKNINFEKTKDSTIIFDREEFISKNIIEILKKDEGAKMYGQFGGKHIPLSFQNSWFGTNNYYSFAAMLNNDERLKSRITSIMIQYYKGKKNKLKINNGGVISSFELPLFMKYSNYFLTIFKLDGENTPFKEVSEKFQYLIINKY